MKTSKPFALLFTKEGCPPCASTKAYRDELLLEEPDLGLYLATLTVQKDSVWREQYKLNKFPTLLIVNDYGEETARVTGGKSIRLILKQTLQTIRTERTK